VDSVWKQKKLEASLPKVALAQGKLLENAADRASELQANIAQPKRMSAGQSPASNAPKKIARYHFIRENVLLSTKKQRQKW